jgi:hypothetical protein
MSRASPRHSGPRSRGRCSCSTSAPGAGPVASSYGQHLVRIDSATAARQRSLPEARADVLELWRTVKAAEREAHTLAELRERYGVVLDEGVRRMIAPSRIVPATWNGQP